MNRRQLLALMGLGPASLALPAASSWGGAPSPKRLVVYLSAQGGAPWRWLCDPAKRGDADWADDWTTWSESTFSDSLRPLHRWRRNVTAVGGVGVVSAVSEGKDQQHRLSAAHVLTGARAVWYTGSAMGGGPSIDQIVADHVASPDQLRSLETSIFKGLGPSFRQAIFRSAMYPLPAATTPQAVFDRLYAPRPAAIIRGSLEQVDERYDTVGRRLSTADRAVLDEHRHLLRAVLTQATGFEARECDGPTEAPDDEEGVAAELDQLLPMLTTALACDLTRVVTIQAGEAQRNELPVPVPGSVHSNAHSIYSDPAAAEVMGAYMAYHAERVADLLDALDSVPEGSGTLLDNTVVLWMSELGDGAHGYDDYPVVIAGGRSCGLRLGRYVHYARTTPVDTGRDGERRLMGMPHNRVLVSIAQAMGLDIDAVGLRSVRSFNGGVVDITGGLPELLG